MSERKVFLPAPLARTETGEEGRRGRRFVQMAQGVGVIPWTVLGRGNPLFSRMARGGGVQCPPRRPFQGT